MKKYEVQLSWVYNVTLDAENEEDACEKARENLAYAHQDFYLDFVKEVTNDGQNR
jgi:hypothetical protein